MLFSCCKFAIYSFERFLTKKTTTIFVLKMEHSNESRAKMGATCKSHSRCC